MGFLGFGKKKAAMATADPVCGMSVDAGTTPFHTESAGRPFYFCSANCLGTFRSDPKRFGG
jgi:P-type Cu+ transporter